MFRQTYQGTIAIQDLLSNPYSSHFESINPPPTHMPTMLIEYWFRSICPMRSSFDSAVNYNRSLAAGIWPSSKPVYLILQAMSAACLAETVPEVRVLLVSLWSDAVSSLRRELSLSRLPHVGEVTVDVVFATFALGTSFHWVNIVDHECEWLQSAQELLLRWKTSVPSMHSMLYSHFRQALIYWSMCITAAGLVPATLGLTLWDCPDLEKASKNNNSPDPELERFLPIQRPATLGFTPWSTRPSSWCGVSQEVIQYFTQVLALCRKTRAYECDHPTNTSLTLIESSHDLPIARELHRDLSSLNFRNLLLLEEAQGYLVDTQDSNTPIFHLLQTAEAYRQAALLQLYMAFGAVETAVEKTQRELVRTPLSQNGEYLIGELSQEYRRIDKALNLLNILQSIPEDSGSMSIHPILYLTAAIALRSNVAVTPTETFSLLRSYPTTVQIAETSTDSANHLESRLLTAQSFIISRLSKLRSSLPHRSSHRLLEVVKNLWTTRVSSTNDVSWIDALTESGLGGLLW